MNSSPIDLDVLLKDIYTQDCWVLNWIFENNNLVFSIQASLWPGHPLYEPPPPDAYTCYKNANLTFHNVSSVNGLLEMEDVKPTIDPDGSKDYGSIDVFRKIENDFEISGDFGRVFIKAENVTLEF
jgi:hypothetical protein